MSNRAPKAVWFSHKWDDGPVKVRRRLYISAPGSENLCETPFFIDTNRYHHDQRNGLNTLYGSGMHRSGCAAALRSGRIDELKHYAEQIAMAEGRA